MDSSALALVVTAAVASLTTALACCVWFARRVAVLRHRLEKAEQSRQAAHEHSSKARAQIAQLSQAIAELHRRHKMTLDTQRKRAELDKNLPSLPESSALPPNSFADTQPL